MKGKFIDLTGKTFNTVTVIKRVENFEGLSDDRLQYLLNCSDCGATYKAPARYLQRRKHYYRCSHCKKAAPNAG